MIIPDMILQNNFKSTEIRHAEPKARCKFSAHTEAFVLIMATFASLIYQFKTEARADFS